MHIFSGVRLAGKVPAEFGKRIRATRAASRRVFGVNPWYTIEKTHVRKTVERNTSVL